VLGSSTGCARTGTRPCRSRGAPGRTCRPSTYVDDEVLHFFTTGTRTLLDAEARAGVGHHVVLSIVGADRTDAGFFRAKHAQEELVRAVVDLAGPERVRFDAFLRGVLAARGDDRDVVTDPLARYFGALLGEGSLVPRGDALRGRTPWARFAAPRTRNLPAGS